MSRLEWHGERRRGATVSIARTTSAPVSSQATSRVGATSQVAGGNNGLAADPEAMKSLREIFPNVPLPALEGIASAAGSFEHAVELVLADEASRAGRDGGDTSRSASDGGSRGRDDGRAANGRADMGGRDDHGSVGNAPPPPYTSQDLHRVSGGSVGANGSAPFSRSSGGGGGGAGVSFNPFADDVITTPPSRQQNTASAAPSSTRGRSSLPTPDTAATRTVANGSTPDESPAVHDRDGVGSTRGPSSSGKHARRSLPPTPTSSSASKTASASRDRGGHRAEDSARSGSAAAAADRGNDEGGEVDDDDNDGAIGPDSPEEKTKKKKKKNVVHRAFRKVSKKLTKKSSSSSKRASHSGLHDDNPDDANGTSGDRGGSSPVAVAVLATAQTPPRRTDDISTPEQRASPSTQVGPSPTASRTSHPRALPPARPAPPDAASRSAWTANTRPDGDRGHVASSMVAASVRMGANHGDYVDSSDEEENGPRGDVGASRGHAKANMRPAVVNHEEEDDEDESDESSDIDIDEAIDTHTAGKTARGASLAPSPDGTPRSSASSEPRGFGGLLGSPLRDFPDEYDEFEDDASEADC